jgi:hypothetical protein
MDVNCFRRRHADALPPETKVINNDLAWVPAADTELLQAISIDPDFYNTDIHLVAMDDFSMERTNRWNDSWRLDHVGCVPKVAKEEGAIVMLESSRMWWINPSRDPSELVQLLSKVAASQKWDFRSYM